MNYILLTFTFVGFAGLICYDLFQLTTYDDVSGFYILLDIMLITILIYTYVFLLLAMLYQTYKY